MPMISRFHGACSFFAWFTSHDSHDSHDTDGRFENVFVTVRRTRAAPSLRRPYGRPGRPVTGVAWLLRVCAVSPFVSLWAPAPRTGCWQLDTSLGTGANLTAKSPGFRSSGPGFAMLFDSLWFSLILFDSLCFFSLCWCVNTFLFPLETTMHLHVQSASSGVPRLRVALHHDSSWCIASCNQGQSLAGHNWSALRITSSWYW